MPHTLGNLSTRAITLLQTLPQSKVFKRSYGPPNSRESQFREFRDSQVGSPMTKWHLGASPWLGTDNTIRVKPPPSLNVGRGESCEFVFAHDSSVHQKWSNYALTNLLFGLCKFVWIIDPLFIHLNPHPRAPAHPFTLKVLRAEEHTPTPYSSVVFTLDS
jgi:hypothetical protein